MTRIPIDTYGGQTQLRVGDTVWIRATVTRIARSEEVEVELFSKTTQYQELVRSDLLELELPEVPDEPPDGTWLHGHPRDDGNSSVFRRDDAEGHNDVPGRRYDRRWWDFAAGEWVDWPTAVARGADPARRLVESQPGG